jgi:hypothetical protein
METRNIEVEAKNMEKLNGAVTELDIITEKMVKKNEEMMKKQEEMLKNKEIEKTAEFYQIAQVLISTAGI